MPSFITPVLTQQNYYELINMKFRVADFNMVSSSVSTCSVYIGAIYHVCRKELQDKLAFRICVVSLSFLRPAYQEAAELHYNLSARNDLSIGKD